MKFINTRRFSKIDLFLQEFQSGMPREALLILTELVQVPWLDTEECAEVN